MSVTTSDSFIRWLRSHARALSASFLIGVLSGIAAGLVMRPAYRVQVVVVPAREDGAGQLLSNLPSTFGGLAALAGVTTGTSADQTEASQFLRSRALAREFIQRRELLPVLAQETRNAEKFTLQDAVRMFQRSILAIDEDRRTDVIVVSMTWHDRAAAAQWANEYVHLANALLQNRAITESERRQKYLETELQKIQSVELRQSANRLIENQMNASMVAHTRSEFAFRTIDPAFAPDAKDRVRPKRALLAIAGGFAGLAVGAMMLIVLARRSRRINVEH